MLSCILTHISSSNTLIFEYSAEARIASNTYSKVDTVIGEATGRYNSPHLFKHKSMFLYLQIIISYDMGGNHDGFPLPPDVTIHLDGRKASQC
jgi:hypothetical protein